MTTKHPTRLRATVLLMTAITFAAACGDLLDVDDPQRFTDEDLDAALEAVATGAEGEMHQAISGIVIFSALIGDEFQHTGTWIGYQDMSDGIARYGTTSSDGPMDQVLRGRFAATLAQQRFQRVLGEAAATSPLMIQMLSVEAWSDLLLAQHWCEAPPGPGEAAVADSVMFRQAVAKLTAVMSTAQATGQTRWVQFNQAGRARANLMLGNYDAALADAQAIPSGFKEVAKYSRATARQRNGVVSSAHLSSNLAAGMRQKWWLQTDTIAGLMRDPWTGALDPRMPVAHPPGLLGVDGRTPFYSQNKYKTFDDDIPLTHKGEMLLIEAEVYWRKNDLANAMDRINQLRTRVGLAQLANPGDANTVFQYLLQERFAELFLEGQRLNDLRRFNLVATTPGLGQGRMLKFPISRFEAINNVNIEDDASKRCQPVS